MIKVNGVEETRLEPGQSLEIGRKPLRPLGDDGRRRLEVPDGTKSMSKRHAVFTYGEDGSAVLRDMGSTNGSYLVQGDGSLVRLPSQADFLLPGSSVRFQFGDVPVDFVQVEAQVRAEDSQARQVPDLFSYANERREPVEPDASGMSVDDILDMRAGEPTGIFRADGVRNRVSALHDMALGAGDAAATQSQIPSQGDQVPAQNVQSAGAPSQPRPDVEPQAQTRQQPPAQNLPETSEQQVPAQSAQGNQQVDGLPVLAQPVGQEGKPPVQRNLFDDARNAQAGEAGTPAPAEQGQPQPQVRPYAGAMPQSQAQSQPQVQPQPQAQPQVQARQPLPVQTQTGMQPAIQPQQHAAQVQHETSAQQPTQEGAFQPLGAVELARMAQQEQEMAGERQEIEVSSADAEQTYRPAFEPGSVFDRVAKGEYGNQEEVIEVDGMSSDDAKRTSDFALQFEMAKHTQLLPFLAMNPALYDDLYAWLSAQGNEDIDEALQANEGYREYLNATGK
ncbi:FHA domain-containing protein [Bifidobacterium coryneforme]|uniref:FHA domain protein n=1 Tax=Bifidobacterium [indicum] DSM 20214 = LMG 11587 TaxID=1341694 RepID=A0A087VVS3_9BIFI|nr:FHA domain-containing protein [Bifidobacterium indicum]AIC92396.1 FHA domain protein [Bifidobacterium indicum LMG 11587 = DSM 20214]